MKKEIKLPFIKDLDIAFQASRPLIQAVIGPRQVGKTTGVHQFLESMGGLKYHYASADGSLAKHGDWLQEQWLTLSGQSPSGMLIIDEVQKIENWSEILKMLWDKQKRSKDTIRVVVLGSSSLAIQRGLSESLTGRFQLHRVHQWNLPESAMAYEIDLDKFLTFGGYPGSYEFISNRTTWLSYIRDSIIDTVIGRDILQLARVKSPALFRQTFDLACAYGGQEISYNKLLGQIQEKGNVELVKHYLELFEGAFLLKQLFKYSTKKTLSRSSSPKIIPLAPALYSVTLDADLNSEERGRSFEISVGCELLRLKGALHYWRERNEEVDYVYSFGKKVVAIEVKSGRKKSRRGLNRFRESFPAAEALLVTPENYQTQIAALRQLSGE